MKAKQQAAEAEKAAKAAANPNLSSEEPQPQAEAQKTDTVVFDGGFFQVESPAKPSGERTFTTQMTKSSVMLELQDLV